MKSWPDLHLPELSDNIHLKELRLFDSKSESIRALSKKESYGIYVCGITPYDATHLGHAATYLTFDLVHRYLKATGAKVDFVQNITDIDDPLLERATRDGVDWQDLANSQIDLFRSDMVDLHILPPTHYVGVMESMNDIVHAIEEISARGGSYDLNGDIYCEIHQDPAFGSRSHISEQEALAIFGERGGDPEKPGKKDPLDPLLWRAHRPGEPQWSSSFGSGRPGWHIECQAIALKYVTTNPSGPLIDIQGGGSDLIFPHHEMSASQVAIQTGREFADFYVHAGMIGLDGEKMSKSRGNLVFVSRLTASGVNPMAIRIALLWQPYRSDRMWSDKNLAQSQQFLDSLTMALSKSEVAPTRNVIQSIADAIAHNLDTPTAFMHLQRWIDATNDGEIGGSAGELSRALDALLGIAL